MTVRANQTTYSNKIMSFSKFPKKNSWKERGYVQSYPLIERELQSRFVGVSPVEYAGKFLQVDDFVIEDKKLTISYNQPAKLSEEAKKKPGIVRD